MASGSQSALQGVQASIKKEHNDKVARVATAVRTFHAQGRKFRIYHGSTNSTRPSALNHNNLLDTSGLRSILHIDKQRKTAVVEPNVPLDALVAATLPCGLIPLVVMEFKGITVGGGWCGLSGESSSFKHGTFDATINWVEFVLADGTLVNASKTENADLFHGAAGACGTLGVVTLLEVQLEPTSGFVELTFNPFTEVQDGLNLFDQESKDETVKYMDGIVLSKDKGYIMTGRFVDKPLPGAKLQKFSRARDPWFYVFCRRAMAKDPEGKKAFKIVSPITDYVFRWDRGAFWTGIYAFKYFLTPFNRITRFLLDPFMHTRVMYHALHESGLASKYFVQDMSVPYASTSEFLEYLDGKLGLYPLWLCPLDDKRHESEQPITYSRVHKGGKVCNVGIWGPSFLDDKEFVRLNRELEHQVQKFNGVKVLYALSFYTREEFWAIYDKVRYDWLRKKWQAENLPDLYEKTTVQSLEYDKTTKSMVGNDDRLRNSKGPMGGDGLFAKFLRYLWTIWPICGLYGVLMVIIRKDYLVKH